jgi:glycerol-3-phosphate dehydrogenase
MARLQNSGSFDILVVGGGIHGATCARLAAQLGFKTALLERADYAGATSSRSSKMAHGGLRYLELFDFEQVFEGIKAREEMFEHIGYLVKPSEFLIPVPTGAYLFRIKLGIGLFLYDLLVKKKSRRHRWVSRSRLTYSGFHAGRHDLMGCYVYTDGLMSDARLVIDNVIGARRSGAVCLNYCGVTGIHQRLDGEVAVAVRDEKRGDSFSIRARVVINCAGPWASEVSKDVGSGEYPLAFSRGSHIVFSKKWDGPSLFLPMPGKARYYFVWPHPAGTLVGTTERHVTKLELDPLPSHDEIEEIFSRLERDIPDAGLSRSSACYAFAGIRSLPLRGKKGDSTVLSRKHIWNYESRILTLLGGKYTTAAWTGLEGVQRAASILNKPIEFREVQRRRDLKELPGTLRGDSASALRQMLRDRGLSEDTTEHILGRYGKRIEGYLSYIDPSPEALIRLETAIALDTEQVESLEDLMRRRLELEYTKGHGERYVEVIREVFKKMRPDIDFESELGAYRARIEQIERLLEG